MKSAKSMPAMAGATFRPLAPGGFAAAVGASMQRSQSMSVNKPQERMRHMARRIPMLAFAGLGSQMQTFVRSFSRANLARLGSRVQSYANLCKAGGGGGSYGSTSDFGAVGGQTPNLGPAPSPFDGSRDFSQSGDSALFGTMFDEDLESMQPGFTLSLGMAVFTAVLASLQVGYNSGVLNVPQDTITAALKLSTLEWSVAVAIFCIGGLLGSISGSRMADQLGRKNFLIANNTLFMAGGLLEALAGGISMLSLGRLLIGIGCGGATVVVPMYLGEIAPANLRGSLGTMNQFAMVIGILIANLLGKPMGGHSSWRYLLGLTLIPSLLQIILSAALLESPLWLLHQNGSKNRRAAEEVLAKLRGTDDVEFDIECMMASVNEESEEDSTAECDSDEEECDRRRGKNGAAAAAAQGSWGDDEYSSRRASTTDVLDGVTPHVEKGSLAKLHPAHSATPPPDADSAAPAASTSKPHSLWSPEYRRPLCIGFGLQLVQQFSGINAVFFYSTAFFTSAHMSDPWSGNAAHTRGQRRRRGEGSAHADVCRCLLCCCCVLFRLGSVLASTVNVLATGLSIYLIERMGRRKLLLISTFGMMLSCVGLTYALQVMAAHSAHAAPAGSAAANSSAAAAGPEAPAWVGFMSVGMVLIFVSFFEVGLGPIPWLIGAEIFPTRVRSAAMSVSSTINWLSNFAVGLSFPSLSLALGPLSFVPFGVVLAVAFVLEYRFVPETQGKTLEEIQESFLAQGGFDDESEDEDGTSSYASGSATPHSASMKRGSVSEDEDVDEDDETAAINYRDDGFQSSSNGSSFGGGIASGIHAHAHGHAADTPATPIPEGDADDQGSGAEDDAV